MIFKLPNTPFLRQITGRGISMGIFLHILLNSIAPIFIMIAVGYLLGKKLDIDIKTLTKMNLYCFVPALVLVKVYETKIDTRLLSAILFTFVLLVATSIVIIPLTRIRKYSLSVSNAVQNAVLFYNSGNFGLPLIMLVFQDSAMAGYAISIQIMVLMVQNLTTNTLGLYNANRGRMAILQSVAVIFRMPTIYGIIGAFLLKLLPWDMTKAFFWPALDFIKDGLVPIALITLGVQLSQAKLDFSCPDVYITSFLRLIGGPALAYLLITIMGYQGVMAQVLLISSSVPTAVNTALIAVEFDNEPDFASQVVLITTLLSAFTITGVIYLARLLYV
jgi:predicted permease